VCACMCMHVCMLASMPVYMCMHMLVCIPICVCVCVQACGYYIYIASLACLCVHVYMFTSPIAVSLVLSFAVSLVLSFAALRRMDAPSEYLGWPEITSIKNKYHPHISNWQVWHSQCQWKKFMILTTSKKNVVGLGIIQFTTMNELKCPWKKEHAIKLVLHYAVPLTTENVRLPLHFIFSYAPQIISNQCSQGTMKVLWGWFSIDKGIS